MTRRTLPLSIVAVVPCLLICHALLLNTALPGGVVAAFAVFILVSALRPTECLVVVTAMAPFMAAFAWHWSRSLRWSEALVITFLTGALLRLVIHPTRGSTRSGPLEFAAIGFAAVVLASWIVELVMLQYTTDFPAHFAHVVWKLFTREFFGDPGAFVRLNVALVVVEGAALALCVKRFAATDRALPTAILRMTVVAAAASAALNVQRMAQIVLSRDGGWHTLVALVATMRFSVLHSDVNAGGSYFAMALPIAVALGVAGRRHAGWFLSAALLAAALWLAGSRTAIAGAGLGVVALLAATTAIVDTRRERVFMGVALAAALTILAIAAVHYPRSRNIPPSAALDVRADMARVALDLFKTRPLFGIGVGTFWQRSEEYIPARLKRFYPHENAHNNFLQILAELGILGLGFFLALLAAATRPLRSLGGPERIASAGALAGLMAFLLTCLAGHPLLTREVAYPFWLVIGAAASLRARRAEDPAPTPAAGVRTNRRGGVMALGFLALLALSIPFRVHYEMRTRDFENVAVGYSRWNSTNDGTRFRWAQPRSRFFVAASAASVLIPLRLGPRLISPAHVGIYLDGRLANTVAVTHDRWMLVRVVLAPGRRPPRYRMIELDVETPKDAGEARAEGPGPSEGGLMVGRLGGS